jgi:preprotein translocase subunit SecE
MDTKKLVNLIYIIAGAVIGYVLNSIIGDAFEYFQVYVKFEYARELPKVIAVLSAAAFAAAGIYNSTMNNYLNEVVLELKKVTWPTRKETSAATVVVIITLLIMAVILYAFDILWAYLIKIVLS